MKIGDVVYYEISGPDSGIGIIIDFNKPGEGGKDFVQILKEDGTIKTYMSWDIELIKTKGMKI